MIAAVADHLGEIEALCRRFGVRRLVVLGSAVDGTFRVRSSDVDFLVEYDPSAGQPRFDAYFDLKHALEALLASPVDLVDPPRCATRTSLRRSRRAGRSCMQPDPRVYLWDAHQAARHVPDTWPTSWPEGRGRTTRPTSCCGRPTLITVLQQILDADP